MEAVGILMWAIPLGHGRTWTAYIKSSNILGRARTKRSRCRYERAVTERGELECEICISVEGDYCKLSMSQT